MKEKLGEFQEALITLEKRERKKYSHLLPKKFTSSLNPDGAFGALDANLGLGRQPDYLQDTVADMIAKGHAPLGLDSLLGDQHMRRGLLSDVYYDPATGQVKTRHPKY